MELLDDLAGNTRTGPDIDSLIQDLAFGSMTGKRQGKTKDATEEAQTGAEPIHLEESRNWTEASVNASTIANRGIGVLSFNGHLAVD